MNGMIERILKSIGWGRLTWEEIGEARRAMGLPYRGRHAGEAHHKVRVVDGGGLCGLEGYETLCWQCHPKVSGEQRRRKPITAGEFPLLAQARLGGPACG
jgi:hypothetical protein